MGSGRHHPASPRPLTRQDPPSPRPQPATDRGRGRRAERGRPRQTWPGPARGIDAGKKIKGRQRHLITDSLGLVLGVIVTAASVHDAAGGKLLLDELAAAHLSVSKVWADGGYQNSVLNHGARLGIDVEVVQRPRAKGFEPLPKRWVIERTFGWLMQHRRLARDYEALPQRSQTMIHWAMANKMSRELTGESTPTW
ncbi:transposase [Streptomyces sp. NPDC060209]|uniref:transposase n=1 Tax=Streptomyces sp. NPDC060209 TaxID=3347073 RepID=UPI00365548E7